jgi:hypothetical protein
MMHRFYKKIRATFDEHGHAPTLRRGGPAACFLLLFCVAVDAAAEPGGISGDFSMIGMTHTPDAAAATDVRPWDGHSDGTFAYRAMSCSAPTANVNNNSSDLPSYNARIPGSRVPASTRAHPMQFTVEEGSVQGTIDLTVCQLAPGAVADDSNGEEREKIFIEFEATPERYSAEEAAFQGEFRITGGTGPYSDLSGQGDIRAYFFCYGEEGCEEKEGLYRDSLFVMQGNYLDPTDPTAASKGRAEDSGSGDAHMH